MSEVTSVPESAATQAPPPPKKEPRMSPDEVQRRLDEAAQAREASTDRPQNSNQDEQQQEQDSQTASAGEAQEEIKTPEISRETQDKESKLITNASLNGKNREINKKLARNGEKRAQKKFNEIEPLTSNEAELSTLIAIGEWKAGDGKLTFQKDGPDGTTSPDPLKIDGVGNIDEAWIEEGSGSTFKVHVMDDDSTVEVSREDLVRAQIKSKGEQIANNFSGKQKELIDLMVNKAKNPDADSFGGKTPDQINRLLREAGDEAGVITNSDLEGFARFLPPGQEKNDFLAQLKESNLPTPAMLDKVLQNAGTGGAIDSLRNHINDLQNKLRYSPGDKATRRELDVSQFKLELYKNSQDTLQTEGASGLIDNIASGRVDTANAKLIKSALRSGSMDAVIPIISKDLIIDPNDSPEAKADKEEKRREIKKRAETVGWLTLMGLILAGMTAGEMTKSLGK